MEIKDSCLCGAVLYVEGFHPEVGEQHKHWLTLHESCRLNGEKRKLIIAVALAEVGADELREVIG